MMRRIKPLTSLKNKRISLISAQKDASIVAVREKKLNRPSWEEQLEKKALFQI